MWRRRWRWRRRGGGGGGGRHRGDMASRLLLKEREPQQMSPLFQIISFCEISHPHQCPFSKSSSRDLFSLLFSWVLIISDRIFLVDICAVSLSTYIWVPERNIFNMNVASMFTYIVNSRRDDLREGGRPVSTSILIVQPNADLVSWTQRVECQ